MRQSCGDIDQHVERRFHVASAIPAKDEFFEIASQVRLSHAVVGAERPSLEICEHAMNPRQEDMCRHRAYDFGAMGEACEAAIAGEAVAEECCTGRHGAGDETSDAGRCEVGERHEADTSRPAIGR